MAFRHSLLTHSRALPRVHRINPRKTIKVTSARLTEISFACGRACYTCNRHKSAKRKNRPRAAAARAQRRVRVVVSLCPPFGKCRNRCKTRNKSELHNIFPPRPRSPRRRLHTYIHHPYIYVHTHTHIYIYLQCAPRAICNISACS